MKDHIMKKIYHQLFMILGLCVMGLNTSCSNDGDFNEWKATYVYLERADYLITQKVYNLSHDATGISGDEVTTTFVAKIQKPISSDIVVDLSTVFGQDQTDQVQMSKKQVTIKAGATSSEEVTVSVPDWSFQLDNLAKTTYAWSISINALNSKDGNVRVSSNLGTINLSVVKSAFTNIAFGVPTEGTLVADRSGWNLKVEDGTRGGAVTNLIDGKTNTDIARDGGEGFWITVDFGKVLTLTGVQARFYGSYYSARNVELFVSKNGMEWVSQSSVNTSGSLQNISFLQPVETRYLKYDMNRINSNTVSVTEFNVYAK